jgi:hypothetical protein
LQKRLLQTRRSAAMLNGLAVLHGRLLNDPTRSEHRVLLVIEVKLTVLKLNSFNVGFLTD